MAPSVGRPIKTLAVRTKERVGATRLATWIGEEAERRWAVIVLVVPVVISMFPIADVIGWPKTLVGAAGLTAAVVIALTRRSKFWTALTLTLGAVVLSWLTLISFNYFVLGWLGIHPELKAGLVIAGAVFAFAAFWYLLAWGEWWPAAALVAPLLAAANVAGIPYAVASLTEKAPVSGEVPTYVSQLDLAIVVPARVSDAQRPVTATREEPAAEEWDVRWSVARTGGSAPGWLALSTSDRAAALAAAESDGAPVAGSPDWRGAADHVVLLDVDGTSPTWSDLREVAPGEAADRRAIARWLADAKQLAPRASVAVLLQSTDAGRLARWRTAVGTRGTVASAMTVGAHSLAEAAQILAVQTPDAAQELTLATRFRPILLFDAGEKLRPLDVDDLFAAGRVSLCDEDQLDGAKCREVTRAADLRNGRTHLVVSRKATRPVANAIYVHPTRPLGPGGPLFLDYWWFLEDNPAKVGKGATCGMGLALPDLTCFDHPSDWEGLTLVLDTSGPEAVPLAVQYAQHNDVVRYEWQQQRAWWAKVLADDERREGVPRSTLAALEKINDVADRPIAFVAHGTHATYARPCARDECRQTLTSTDEQRHGGEESWSLNDTTACAAARCVRLAPTRANGHEPALWNAYTGLWGARTCILRGGYCTSAKSPGSPSTQKRYKDPTRIKGWVDERDQPRPCGGEGQDACPALLAP